MTSCMGNDMERSTGMVRTACNSILLLDFFLTSRRSKPSCTKLKKSLHLFCMGIGFGNRRLTLLLLSAVQSSLNPPCHMSSYKVFYRDIGGNVSSLYRSLDPLVLIDHDFSNRVRIAFQFC